MKEDPDPDFFSGLFKYKVLQYNTVRISNKASTSNRNNASVNCSCAQPPPLTPGYCGAFARLVSSVGEAFANFALPGANP